MNKQELIEKTVLKLNGEFPQGDEWLYMFTSGRYVSGASGGVNPQCICSREEFNATADRMRGKPDWRGVLAKHPEAQYLAQWAGVDGIDAGLWISYSTIPIEESIGYLVDEDSKVFHHNKGALIGDWRKTLEKRPEHIVEANEKVDPLNGYKWGVEYPTNGDSPDLPDDCQVRWFDADISGITTAGDLNWDGVINFEIIDQRYKPRSEPAQTKSWFKAGELPPVGSNVEYREVNPEDWASVFIVAKHHFDDAVIFSYERDCGNLFYGYKGEFRPTKTEREKVIDAAMAAVDEFIEPRQTIEALYDAGMLKLPESK